MIERIPQPEPTPPTPPEGSSDSRGWAVAAHLTPWIAGFLGPLIIWLAKMDDPYVEDHARESLNFQISLFIYLMVSALLIIVLIGILLFFAFAILGLVTTIIGAIRASNGETYRYPLRIRFVKAPARRQ